ncbi:HotDog domain-containing protein [Cerioporus squamosus]|nr:HotDog domain-containing protein [Cerioporus squamosus]
MTSSTGRGSPNMASGSAEVRFSSNLTPQHRAAILDFEDLVMRRGPRFGRATTSRLELREVDVYERPEDQKLHARVVFEIDMAEDMLNLVGNMHGGCTMHLIDVCTTIALNALRIAMDKEGDYVSHGINTVFHAPAKVGARLELINTTTAWGSRAVSARTEIWDITNRRLVATGIQNQMQTARL